MSMVATMVIRLRPISGTCRSWQTIYQELSLPVASGKVFFARIQFDENEVSLKFIELNYGKDLSDKVRIWRVNREGRADQKASQ